MRQAGDYSSSCSSSSSSSSLPSSYSSSSFSSPSSSSSVAIWAQVMLLLLLVRPLLVVHVGSRCAKQSWKPNSPLCLASLGSLCHGSLGQSAVPSVQPSVRKASLRHTKTFDSPPETSSGWRRRRASWWERWSLCAIWRRAWPWKTHCHRGMLGCAPLR